MWPHLETCFLREFSPLPNFLRLFKPPSHKLLSVRSSITSLPETVDIFHIPGLTWSLDHWTVQISPCSLMLSPPSGVFLLGVLYFSTTLQTFVAPSSPLHLLSTHSPWFQHHLCDEYYLNDIVNVTSFLSHGCSFKFPIKYLHNLNGPRVPQTKKKTKVIIFLLYHICFFCTLCFHWSHHHHHLPGHPN